MPSRPRPRLLLLFAISFCIWCLLSHPRHLILLRQQIREEVDNLLDKAVARIVSSLDTDNSNAGALNVLGIKEVQDLLACYVQQGTWSDQSFTPNTRCFSTHLAERRSTALVLDLCSVLRTKKILLVGSETTFYLHSLWLHSLSETFNVSDKCLGAEFCTFHHICVNQTILDSSSATRIKKVPGLRELSAHGSSILRFFLSTTLFTSNDIRDRAYTTPIIDVQTGIRVKNAFWMNQARKSDVLVMSRSPIPAPASTYVFGKDTMGNWSFVNDLYLNQSTRYFNFEESKGRTATSRMQDRQYQLATRIVNAALHSTLTIYLPGIMQTLLAIQKDPAIRSKVLIWHGTWYLHPICTNHGITRNIPLEPQLLPVFDEYDNDILASDSWSSYYNAQGMATVYQSKHDNIE
ncbi:hypothetical protein AX17_001479 [Amanita inopinata Kibby_2008]|nr:hypothetical protein AX17_001479 [Amanita inopinata Kibby_2008]